MGGGQEIRVWRQADKSRQSTCTSGYIAYKDNQAFMVTAGHCLIYASSNNKTYDVVIGDPTNG